MLKLLEGADVEVPVGASSKNAMVPMVTVNTRNILFICGGAFPDLDSIIKERLNQESSMGFKAALKDQYDEDENILQKVTAVSYTHLDVYKRQVFICALGYFFNAARSWNWGTHA